MARCLECPAGKYQRTGRTSCFHCPRGKYAYGAKNSFCSNCAPGKHTARTITANCDGCPAGRFQHLWGKYFCYGCPVGKFNRRVGQSYCPTCPHCFSSGNVAKRCYSLARNCRVSQWTKWGKCDKSCSEGKAHRTRSVVVTPICGGKSCPILRSAGNCMLRPCECLKVKCKFEKHTCTDYAAHGVKGWLGISTSNKGNCHNAGAATKLCGHNVGKGSGYQGNGGHCSTGPRSTHVRRRRRPRTLSPTPRPAFAETCGDNDHKKHLKLINGAWVAVYPGTKYNPSNANAKQRQALAEYRARHRKFWATCTGIHQSIRVYHDKTERTFTSRGKKYIEGHHCKMIGTSCHCRCHRMFRHNYFPSTLAHFPCAHGSHHYFKLGVKTQLCVRDGDGKKPSGVSAFYNPTKCDNTNPMVTQPKGMPGRKKFGKGMDDHFQRDQRILSNSGSSQTDKAEYSHRRYGSRKGDLESWSCKKDNSKFDFNFFPKHWTPQPTPFPTPAPTPNPCVAGRHRCDRTNGFCLKASHSSYKCGCNTDYVLAVNKRTCILQPGANRL